MRRNILKKSLKFLGFAFFSGYMAFSNPVYAIEKSKETTHEKIKKETSIFSKGKISFQANLGVLSSSACNIGPEIPDLDYTQINLRLGRMLNEPTERKFFPRGNLETLLELNYSKIHKGFGTYFTGATFLLRYNIVKLDWKIIPYAQAGLGIVFTDAHKDTSQQAIGRGQNFNLQASTGVRYKINEKWSIDSELKFEHFSCGSFFLNNSNRNNGTNSLGGFAGFTYNF